MNAALARITDEGQEIIRDIAIRESAKVVAIRAGITPRHVYNLREEIGQPQLAWPHFFMLAISDSRLREKALEWLAADNANGDDPGRVLSEIARLLQQRGQGA